MKIVLGRFIKKKEEFDSENIVCPIKGYDRDKYLNRRIIIRILFVILYGYELGYMLALNSNTINDIKVTVINSCCIADSPLISKNLRLLFLLHIHCFTSCTQFVL